MNKQIIIYQSQEDFIKEIFNKINNDQKFVLINDIPMYNTNVFVDTPYGQLNYPTSSNSCYSQYVEWLKLPYWMKLINPPIFYSN